MPYVQATLTSLLSGVRARNTGQLGQRRTSEPGPLYTYRGTQAMMKQLKKDGAGGWSMPVPPREKSPERETTPEQIRADAECALVAHLTLTPTPTQPQPQPSCTLTRCVFAVLDYDGTSLC